MILKILTGIFIFIGILAFFKLKYLPLWLRLGLAIVMPIFLIGMIILLSWVFAFVLIFILIFLVLGVIWQFKVKFK